jgi:hypothetical protein
MTHEATDWPAWRQYVDSIKFEVQFIIEALFAWVFASFSDDNATSV